MSLVTSEEYDFRYSSGVTKPVSRIRFSDKQEIVNALCLHFVVFVCLAEMEQLRRGLSVEKFETLMEAFPQQLIKASQSPQCEVTSEVIEDLFPPVFSPTGSNKRAVEEAIYLMWLRYIQYVESESAKLNT